MNAQEQETGPQMLQRLGLDAEKWCAEMVNRGAVQADPAPGQLFHAWMCNAIMAAYDSGTLDTGGSPGCSPYWIEGIGKMTINLAVASLLTADGRPMRQMARDLDIDPGYLSRLISGEKPFHPNTLTAVLGWLGVSDKSRRNLHRLAARDAGWDI